MANRAHGVVTRAQALQAGLSERQIDRRVATGSLIRVHRGVYRVGHRAPSVEAQYLAAVWACGGGALCSGHAAGHLLGALKGRPPHPEVTAPRKRRVPGVITHHSRAFDRRDATTWRGIPVTTMARTLVDLAAVLSPDALARACHEAGIRHRTTPAHVDAVLKRRPSSPGASLLRRVLHGDIPVTLSKLERGFLAGLAEIGLPPPPETNRPAGSYRVDFRWPEQRLTVELDGYRYHSSRHAWEQDRRREREARARGDEFRRYTFGDVFEDPIPMWRELSDLLGVAGR